MIDWTASMQQTFEFYVVDPVNWRDIKRLNCVTSCTITRDIEAETLGSATFTVTELLPECYIRVYLIAVQNGVTEKHCLGTFLVQTPSTSFDGKNQEITMDGYTPLLELKEKMPPIGYSLLSQDKDQNPLTIAQQAYNLVKENLRPPVIKPSSSDGVNDKLEYNFVAEPDETWLSFITALLANADMSFELDDTNRVGFIKNRKTEAMTPIWTFDDGNSSILQPEISVNYDIYGIPNVVEVVYSKPDGTGYLTATATNDDPTSPTSTISRGRKIVYRETSPDTGGVAESKQLDQYAKQLLEQVSSLDYTASYTHGYCPVRLNDCVRLNYTRAGMTGIKARIIRQTIKCEPGCPVSETVKYTKKLWR